MALRTGRGPRAADAGWIGFELSLGLLALGAAALAGLLFARRPGPDRIDQAGLFYLPADVHSHLANEVVRLGSRPAVLAVVVVVFLLGCYRDWLRALCCAVAPVLALEVVERIAKPMVGRVIDGGGYTYPSGTVTAVAALAAALYLTSPRLLRPLTGPIGVLATGLVGAAVLVLRWHYPTDVFGGACVGAGMVFTLDGLAHVPFLVARPGHASQRRRAVAGDLVSPGPRT